jgi:hypothetical protein
MAARVGVQRHRCRPVLPACRGKLPVARTCVRHRPDVGAARAGDVRAAQPWRTRVAGCVSGVIGALVIVGLPLPIALSCMGSGQVIAPCLGASAARMVTSVPAHLLERTDGAFKLLTIAYATAIFSAAPRSPARPRAGAACGAVARCRIGCLARRRAGHDRDHASAAGLDHRSHAFAAVASHRGAGSRSFRRCLPCCGPPSSV